MIQEYIIIKKARENNLKDVSLEIPGIGKSSIVFDTIATEAQRQLNENFSCEYILYRSNPFRPLVTQ